MTSLRDMISQFNAHASKHLETQSLNPFSAGFNRSGRSPSPAQEKVTTANLHQPESAALAQFAGNVAYLQVDDSSEEVTTKTQSTLDTTSEWPLAGSKTEERGMRAKSHIYREILELCEFIYDLGSYQMKQKKNDPDYDDVEDDGTVVVNFGELFEMYTRINDKLVGLLIAAKKKGFVYFEPEILFQRRDDDVLIALTKPLAEIRSYMKEQLAPPSPLTVPTLEL